MEKNKLGMLLFIASESIFFLLLILAYVYFRTIPEPGPAPASSLDPLVTGFFSLFLFSSSYTVWLASKNFLQKNAAGVKRWLAATIVLGLIFILGQAYEWRTLITHGTTISTNLFGTTFFTLTGFHGLHVIIGLIMLTSLLGVSWKPQQATEHGTALETISYYWHFVDGVWVVIFSIVYLTILI